MAAIRPQTDWALEVWILCNAPVQDALNQRFANNGNLGQGYGPSVFSVGLSGNGAPPAQAYHAQTAMRAADIGLLTWLVAQPALSKCWVWIRVKEEYLHRLVQTLKSQVGSEFDKAEFKDLDYANRAKAYVKIQVGGERIDSTQALNFIRTQAGLNLQPIT